MKTSYAAALQLHGVVPSRSSHVKLGTSCYVRRLPFAARLVTRLPEVWHCVHGAAQSYSKLARDGFEQEQQQHLRKSEN